MHAERVTSQRSVPLHPRRFWLTQPCLYRLVPDAVVRGLQLAVGLPLAQSGIKHVWATVTEVRSV